MQVSFRLALLSAVILAPLGFLGCGGQPEPAADDAAAENEYLVYFGTYTREESEGIYAYRFNAATGELTSLGLAAQVANPSFLAVHPNQRFLYSVSERQDFDADNSGGVSAFRIDAATGKLELLNEVSSRGPGPCHLNLDQNGQTLAVANYNGGSVAAFPVAADGRLGEAASFFQHEGSSVNPRRQQEPHAHSTDFSPDNRFLAVSDLGLDQVKIYRLGADAGIIEANDPAFAEVAPGSGPRHFAFHPSASYAYAINEIQSTVTAFSFDAEAGALEEIETVSTLPEGFDERNSTAELAIHGSGKFLYGSNRGHNSIVVFAIDEATGKLTLVEHVSTQGDTPRSFGIDPTGSYFFAANQNSDTVVVFRIDQQTGKLTPTGDVLEIDAPVCVKFVAVKN